jgi:sarcosine oxidase
VVVVTAGAWTQKVLGGVLPLPRLRVTQEQPAHFAPLDATTLWPSFNHAAAGVESAEWWPANVYGMPSPGEGVKIGWHGAGRQVDPDARDYLPDPDVQAALRRYAEEWSPGVDPDSAAPISCTYTWSEDHDFILDRRGRVVVGAGFSGHGFKFTPAIGRILADLADDAGRPATRFRLDR